VCYAASPSVVATTRCRRSRPARRTPKWMRPRWPSPSTPPATSKSACLAVSASVSWAHYGRFLPGSRQDGPDTSGAREVTCFQSAAARRLVPLPLLDPRHASAAEYVLRKRQLISACDLLLRRCRTVVRCSRLPAEIVCTRLIEGHGIQPRWCRSWVSRRPSMRTPGGGVVGGRSGRWPSDDSL
jgi:hypothetical protein